MDQGDGGPGVDERYSARPVGLVTVAVLACLALTVLVGLAAADPGFLVSLLPAWFAGPTALGRTLQVAGGLALAVPVTAALVAGVRGRTRAVGWFVVVAVLALVPAVVAVDRGAFKVQQARQADAPPSEQCVERSGGDTTCPGG